MIHYNDSPKINEQLVTLQFTVAFLENVFCW